MDPLSMTASIIAVLQLTAKVTSYINDVRNATKEQAQVAVEASVLYSLLTTLRFRVESAELGDAWFNQTKLLGLENGPLDQYKEVLEKMISQLSSDRKRDQAKSALLWKFTKKDMENALAKMERLKSLICLALTNDLMTLSKEIHANVVILEERSERLDNYITRKQQTELSQWLKIPDLSMKYQTALEKRHPGTGEWLLTGQDFGDWKSSMHSLLWLHGNAGCGKTVLSAASLENMLQYKETQTGMIVAYYYFAFNDTDSNRFSNQAIRSLLYQFALQGSAILGDLEQLFTSCHDGQQQPTDSIVNSLFSKAVAFPGQKYIILDALDECADREKLLAFICEITKMKAHGLHILATSRREKNIEEVLSLIADHKINIQSAVVDADIRIYIRDRMAADTNLKKWPPTVREDITNTLMAKAGGMFLWVSCQLESIRRAIKPSALRKALSALPDTLDKTYNQILENVQAAGQLEDAIKVLQWLCFSNRPLWLEEVVEIIALNEEADGGFSPDDRLPDFTDVMVICSSLITLDPIEIQLLCEDETPILVKSTSSIRVRLAHLSVAEYLTSERCGFASYFQPPICHLNMAKGCLRYLMYLGRDGLPRRGYKEGFVLSLYAAEYWWQHALSIGDTVDDELVDLSTQLLTDEETALYLWLMLYFIDKRHPGPAPWLTREHMVQPLYYAAHIGIVEVLNRILAEGGDVNAYGGRYSVALQAATVHGHEKVVARLIEAGADVNANTGRTGNTLHIAAILGNEHIVKKLMDAGADVHAKGGEYGTVLGAASACGFENLVRMFLDAGADVNARGSDGKYATALEVALAAGNERIVEILLEAGADPKAPTNK